MKHKHYSSIFRPSSSDIWSKCEGFLSELMRNMHTPAKISPKDSSALRRGNALHSVFEFINLAVKRMSKDELLAMDLSKYIDCAMEILEKTEDNGTDRSDVETLINGHRELLKGLELHKYDKIDFSVEQHLTINEILNGTCDLVVHGKKDGELDDIFIIDLKTGVQQGVVALHNTQLVCYSIPFYNEYAKKANITAYIFAPFLEGFELTSYGINTNKDAINYIEYIISYIDTATKKLKLSEIRGLEVQKRSIFNLEYKVSSDCTYCPLAESCSARSPFEPRNNKFLSKAKAMIRGSSDAVLNILYILSGKKAIADLTLEQRVDIYALFGNGDRNIFEVIKKGIKEELCERPIDDRRVKNVYIQPRKSRYIPKENNDSMVSFCNNYGLELKKVKESNSSFSDLSNQLKKKYTDKSQKEELTEELESMFDSFTTFSLQIGK